MIRRCHLLLLGGSSPPKSLASCSSPSSPRRFLKHLLGSAAALSPAAADPCSLTLHFLRNSCGLSEPAATKAAARVHLRSTKRAHAVLALFRGLGLAGADLARVVAAAPDLLNYRADVTLAPKIDFFRRDVGLSDADIRRTILTDPYRVLCYSLANRLRPNYLRLKELLGTDQNVLAAVNKSSELIHGNVQSELLPKVKVLREYGATDDVIIKLVTKHPRSLKHSYGGSLFNETFAAMKELGVSPSHGIFPHAFAVLARMYPSGWKRKMDNYLSLGWTEDQVKQAFVRHPYCISVSADKVRLIWHFFADKLGWSPEYVSASPMVFSLSYEKRLLPRYRVLDILVSKGHIRSIRIAHLILGEKKFVEKYVTSYMETIPQVLEAYRAGTDNAVAAK
jgi:mTERF domain-containing protein